MIKFIDDDMITIEGVYLIDFGRSSKIKIS